MVQLIKRLDKGTPLSYEEMDRNLDIINIDLETKITTNDSSMAIITAINNIRGGVNTDADTLAKLNNFIIILESTKCNISDIVNVLNSNDLSKPLSAAQGKSLRDALDVEISNRISSSGTDNATLTNAILSETTARQNADLLEISNRNAAILSESNSRIEADNNEATIRANAIIAEQNARTSALNTEINNRITAISNENINRNLAITNEASARTAAVNALGTRIDNVLNNIDATALNSLAELVTAFQNADNNLITSINTLTTNSNEALSTEIINRVNADTVTLNSAKAYTDSNINAEILNRTNSDSNQTNALITETNRAIDIETNLRTDLNSEISNRTTSINTEINNRILDISNEVTNRNTAIATETDARLAADSLEVSNRESAIITEANARIATDALKINITDINNTLTSISTVMPLSANQGKVLKDSLDSQVSTINTNINLEITNRTNAINSEALARTTADTTEVTNRNLAISNAISIEVTDRDNAILVETNNRTTSDTTETNARIASDNALGVRIDNILTNVDATALNSLSELVTAFQAADSNLTTSINNLSSSASSNLSTEITNRTNADTNNLATAKTYTDTSISTEVTNRNTEISNSVAIETQNRIDADSTEVINRNNAINTSISTEVINRNTAITSAINTEIINRNNADADVQSNASIDATTKANAAQAAAITASTPSSHIGSSGTSHANVSTTVSGFMSASDKVKLDGIAAGAQSNLVTSVAGKAGIVTLVKADVGLSNVDNTSDSTKSVNYSSSSLKINSQGPLAATAVGTSRGSNGLNLFEVYNNGYPINFGNILHLNGTGSGQLLVGWSGVDGNTADNYIRSKRDNDTGAWSPWAKILTDNNLTNLSQLTNTPGFITNGSNIFNGGQFITEIDKGSVSTGTVTFNSTNSNVQKLTVSGPLTIALSGFPPSGIFGGIFIELVNGGSSALTLPTINWLLPTTGAPAASFAAYLTAIGRNPATLQITGTDFLCLWTTNGGTTVFGKII